MTNDSLGNAYRTLEVEHGAAEDRVKDAYRLLMNVWHPDRFEGNARLQKQAEEKTKSITAAYAALRAAGFPHFSADEGAQDNQRPEAPGTPSSGPKPHEDVRAAENSVAHWLCKARQTCERSQMARDRRLSQGPAQAVLSPAAATDEWQLWAETAHAALEALALDLGNEEAWDLLGWTLKLESKYGVVGWSRLAETDSLEHLCRAATQLHPSLAWAWYATGLIAKRRAWETLQREGRQALPRIRDYDRQAVLAYREAVRCRRDFKEAWTELLLLYFHLSEKRLLVETFDEMNQLGLDPSGLKGLLPLFPWRFRR
jgi:hypothetical protein